MTLRPAEPRDEAAIRRIERASGSRSWEFLRYDSTVAEIDGIVVGYLVVRTVAAQEFEILNVAVAPEFRRAGVARALLRDQLNGKKGDWFLEVRESNVPARSLYAALGFQVAGTRPGYYSDPPETGVVMRFCSC